MADIKSTDLLQQFASDNYSGICPEAWAAMEAANHGHVSGYGDEKSRRRSRDVGFDHYLVKPIEPDELKEAIERCSLARPGAECRTE